MNQTVSVRNNIDFTSLFNAVRFTEDDIIQFARIIVQGMTRRIDEQVTSKGEAISQNSQRWLAEKLSTGGNVNSLIHTGKLRLPETYELKIEGDTATIQLIGEYTEVHLDLIEISEATGKNYMDWFGIAESDIEDIMEAAQLMLENKLRAIL